MEKNMIACIIGQTNRLPGGVNFMHPDNIKLAKKIRTISRHLISNYNVNTFILGNSQELDLLALKVLKKLSTELSIELNIKSFEIFKDVTPLDFEIERIDLSTSFEEFPNDEKKKMGIKCMINSSDYMVSICDESKNLDLKNDYAYFAEKSKIKVFNINPNLTSRIYTSYIGNMKNLSSKFKNEDFVLISRHKPNSLNVKHYPNLAPSNRLLGLWKHCSIGWSIYEIIYKFETLNNLIQNEVAEEIGNNKVMVCYEKTGENCHRHILRDWFAESGIEILEIDNELNKS